MKSRWNNSRFAGPVMLLCLGLGRHSSLADASLAIGSRSSYPGSTVSVPVYLANGSNVVGAQFDLSFNPNAEVGFARIRLRRSG